MIAGAQSARLTVRFSIFRTSICLTPVQPAPRAMQPSLRQNQRRPRLIGAVRRTVRPVAARFQSRRPKGRIALQMLVARLAADPKLLTPIADAEASAARQYDESIDLFPIGYFLPRRRGDMCNVSPRFVPVHFIPRFSVYSVVPQLISVNFCKLWHVGSTRPRLAPADETTSETYRSPWESMVMSCGA